MRVVFVPGFTQGAASWAPLIDQVPGDDPWPIDVPDDLDFVATASAIGDVGGSATYFGYSMGGRLALQLALDRPDLVEQLVLVSASPGIAEPAARAARRDADATLARRVERDGVDAFLAQWLAQPMFATLPAAAAGLDDRRRVNTVARLTHQLQVLGQGTQPSNWERLAELQMPVLLIVGALDTRYVGIAEQMAAVIPAAYLEVIAGAGHACHLEQPDAVAHRFSSWPRPSS
jgi:2-succinyl-6-hydroxy-2,4-cyclohexadiene-1-carboxylate synthase